MPRIAAQLKVFSGPAVEPATKQLFQQGFAMYSSVGIATLFGHFQADGPCTGESGGRHFRHDGRSPRLACRWLEVPPLACRWLEVLPLACRWLEVPPLACRWLEVPPLACRWLEVPPLACRWLEGPPLACRWAGPPRA